jgi:hypothetical protein
VADLARSDINWLVDVARKKGAIPPPRLQPGAAPMLPREDHAELLEARPSMDELLGMALFITYRDSAGAESRRRITVRSVDRCPPDDYVIRGFCHERQAVRQFRARRIEEVTDPATGEIVRPAWDWLDRVFAFALGTLAPADATCLALKRCRTGLHILTYLARCDGFLHEAEVAQLATYVMTEAADLTPDTGQVVWFLQHLYPDSEIFHSAINRLSFEGVDYRNRVLRFAKRIIEADGVIHPSEVEEATNLPRPFKL